MDFDTVIVLGPQGSGKSTQGKMLAERLGFFFWDTGDIIRRIASGSGPLAEKVAPNKKGILLSDETIIEVMKTRLSDITPGMGVVFDGVPRRIGQARFLVEFLKGQGRRRPVTMLIDVPHEVSIERLTKRAAIEKRVDDTPDAIAERLNAYRETMRPVMDYMKEETNFIVIDGRPPEKEVSASIDKALGLPVA